ncbi:MAG: carbohydrate-binding domain-containing protein [Bacteroidaceae bacterium]|nr:carbohydrate-binding domain-containing protein [Bacteroidaceae bacterium]
MKKALLFIGVLVASFTQAQTLYINNNDGTYLTVDTKKAGDIRFDEIEQTIYIEQEDRIASQFATSKITNIAPVSNNGTELIYNVNPTVEFNTSDQENFDEITRTVPTDDTDDEYDDFVENFQAEAGIITITFSETGVRTSSLTSGITATINGGHIVINSTVSGKIFQVKGTCSNGSLKIYSSKKFRMLLNNLTLTNPTGPAINIQGGKRAYLSIYDGTTNTLCDGATYNAPVIGSNGEEEDQKGTLFSEGELLIDGYKNGTGTLNVTSLGGHAICSDDYIIVRGGNINILSAAKDGFRTKDKFIIGRTEAYSPNVTINATSNGIECTEGTLTIEAGKLDITAGGEAIKVEYEETVPDPAVIPDAYIKGGYIKLTTTGEKSSAIQTTRNYTQSGGVIQATVNGNGSKIINCDGDATFSGGKLTGVVNGTVSSDETSAGGIKCNGNVTISDSKVAIDCKGKGAKGINCDNYVTVNSGEVTIIAAAEDYTEIEDDKKSRAIQTNYFTINNGIVVAKAYDYAISSGNAININGGIVNAISLNCIALEIGVTQTGGWLLTKD